MSKKVIISFVLCANFLSFSATNSVLAKSNGNTDKQNSQISKQDKKQKKPSYKEIQKKVEYIVNSKPEDFDELKIQISYFYNLYTLLKSTEDSTDKLQIIVNEVCAKKAENEDLAAKCKKMSEIIIEDLEKQYNLPEDQKLSNKNLMILILTDLVFSGIISDELINDIDNLENDLDLLIDAYKNYSADEGSKEEMYMALNALIEDIKALANKNVDEENVINLICERQEYEKFCLTVLSDVLTGFTKYESGEFDQKEFADDLVKDIENLIDEEVKVKMDIFIKTQNEYAKTLIGLKEIIENNLGENEGSKALYIDYQDLILKIENFSKAFNEFYNQGKKLMKDKANSKEYADDDIYTYKKEIEIINLAKDLLSSYLALNENYERYFIHENSALHLIRTINQEKIIENHGLYFEDLYDIVEMAEIYGEKSLEDLKNSIKEEKTVLVIESDKISQTERSLMTMLRDINPIISNLNKNWLDSFNLNTMSEYSAKKDELHIAQQQANNQIFNIYEKELVILKEVCEKMNSEQNTLCTYDYGSVIEVIKSSEDKKDLINGLCDLSSDPEKCKQKAASMQSVKEKIEATEEINLNIVLGIIAKEFLAEAGYEIYVNISSELELALNDGELSDDELADLKEVAKQEVKKSDFMKENVDVLLTLICRDAKNLEQCKEDLAQIKMLIDALYNKEISTDEFASAIFKEIIEEMKEDPKGNISEINRNVTNLVNSSIILNDYVIRLLENRGLDNLIENLIANLNNLKNEKIKIQDKFAAIEELIKKIDVTTNKKEKAKLNAELGKMIIEYTDMIMSLQNYYIENYYPTIYSGFYRIGNDFYGRNMDRTILETNNALNLVLIYEDNLSKKISDLNKVKQDFNGILNIAVKNNDLIEKSNENLENVLKAAYPDISKRFEDLNARNIQLEVNKGVEDLIAKKIQLIAYLYAQAQI